MAPWRVSVRTTRGGGGRQVNARVRAGGWKTRSPTGGVVRAPWVLAESVGGNLRVGMADGLLRTMVHSDRSSACVKYATAARHSGSNEGSPKAGPQTYSSNTMARLVLGTRQLNYCDRDGPLKCDLQLMTTRLRFSSPVASEVRACVLAKFHREIDKRSSLKSIYAISTTSRCPRGRALSPYRNLGDR